VQISIEVPYNVALSGSVQRCSLRAGCVTSPMSENHSHASGDGKVQPRQASSMFAFLDTVPDAPLTRYGEANLCSISVVAQLS
jgi:hypothetical protein